MKRLVILAVMLIFIITGLSFAQVNTNVAPNSKAIKSAPVKLVNKKISKKKKMRNVSLARHPLTANPEPIP